jgi:CDP-diacylglycerol--glycerol-3-phosphate 3-phosphatidyltransferase
MKNPTVVWNLPNALSLLRIGLIPILLYCLTDPGRVAGGVAAAVFFLACLSDFFDGYLARRRGLTTTLGEYLDPLADKLIVATALIMLVGMVREPRLAAWVVVVIVGRELAVTGLRGIASREGVSVAAESLGKYKMVFQMFALHGLLIHYTYGPALFRVDFHAAGMLFLWVAMILSVWSGAEYHVRVIRAMVAKRRRPERMNAAS